MNVLVVGLGSIGRKHVKVLKELEPDCEIYALRSKVNASHENNIKNIYSVKDIPWDVDFIIISNPTVFHGGTIEKLIGLNKPFFIEKPVLHDINDLALTIFETIKTNNIFTYVGCPLRFHPCISFVRNYLEVNNPRLNEVNIYCGSYLPDWRPERNFRETYSAQPDLGGGAHLDLIHEIDYAYYLFGKPQDVLSLFRNVSSLSIPAIDYAHYCLSYPKFSASITLNYFRKSPKRSLELVFDKDIWLVDLLSSTITNKQGEIIFSKEQTQLLLLKEQMKYFIGSYNDSSPSRNSFEESLVVLKICLNKCN